MPSSGQRGRAEAPGRGPGRGFGAGRPTLQGARGREGRALRPPRGATAASSRARRLRAREAATPSAGPRLGRKGRAGGGDREEAAGEEAPLPPWGRRGDSQRSLPTRNFSNTRRRVPREFRRPRVARGKEARQTNLSPGTHAEVHRHTGRAWASGEALRACRQRAPPGPKGAPHAWEPVLKILPKLGNVAVPRGSA